jgi:hypothetical protein
MYMERKREREVGRGEEKEEKEELESVFCHYVNKQKALKICLNLAKPIFFAQIFLFSEKEKKSPWTLLR